MGLNVAIIGIPGAWSSEILKEEFEKRNTQATILSIQDLNYNIQSNKVFYQEIDLESFDAIIIKKLGKYAPRIIDWLAIFSKLEDKGLRFFSSPKKLKAMISRIGCTSILSQGEVKMPKTIITENIEVAENWIKSVGGAVFKPNFSTKATGMTILKSDEPDLTQRLTEIQEEFDLLYLQELIDLPGEDYGVTFIDGKYVGTYARIGSKESWNTTTKDGGHYGTIEPTDEIMNIAQKAQKLFGLDFCCVDVATPPSGAIVFEVSAFGGFKGLSKGANINAAEILTDYITQELN
jgi:ribosomal protein S6--L-glutamate ligase